MQLGDIANAEMAGLGKPLDGVRILAAEQMQALPYATQLLGRLGADVVKVEHPVHGESGRAALPDMADPQGRRVGATFLRNNLGKKAVGIDLKAPQGKKLFLDLAANFDVVGENFKAGTMDKLEVGWDVISARYPRMVFVSVSGFGNLYDSPYRSWPAYAMVPEAMSGLYDYNQRGDEPPRVVPAGALGDISSALFAVIGVLSALRHRDATGLGQRVDVAMLDSMIAMTDMITNFWSLGRTDNVPDVIMSGYRASDGWFAMQVARVHQFERLAELIGRPDWLDDPRLNDRSGWAEHQEALVRPALEEWAKDKTRLEVCELLSEAGIAAGPCLTAPEVITDEHVARRNMLVSMDRIDGDENPVLIPGNPVKMSRVAEGPETRVPWVGEHTDEVLRSELGLGDDELTKLRADGIIT
jgi:crotonobetainyl-CoA:carnitine CoA-transferase CaiB-like acyl-CoA transferase